MRTIGHNTRTIDLPDHTEHYISAHNGRIVKFEPSVEECHYNLEFSADGSGYQDSLYSLPYHVAEHLIKAFLVAPEAVQGECFDAWINQAERDCEVIKVNRTRARIWYEMPNTGDREAWRKIFTIAGVQFVDDGYHTATTYLERNR